MERESKRDNERGLGDNGSSSSYRTRKSTIIGVSSFALISFGFNLAMDAFTKLKEGESIPARIEAVSTVKHDAEIAELRAEIKSVRLEISGVEKSCNDKITAAQGTLNTINSILIGKALR